MDDLIARTVTALRNGTHRTDPEIYRALVAEGMKPAIAADLVLFLPIAYGRLILDQLEVRFSDFFRRRLANGDLTEERSLSSDPTWNAVAEFARKEVRSGVSRNQLLAVAMRSAEFDAANQLLHRGSEIHDLRFTPVVLLWPDGGPQT
jgi:hypothetical protein